MVPSDNYEERLRRVECIVADLQRDYVELKRSTSTQVIPGHTESPVPKRGRYKKTPTSPPLTSTR